MYYLNWTRLFDGVYKLVEYNTHIKKYPEAGHFVPVE